MSSQDADSNRSASEIESSLENTRMRIDHTLELLADRCRPSAIADQAWRYVRAKNEDGATSRLQETVVRNPLPVVLMGVGLAWLLTSGRDGSVPQPDSPLVEGAQDESQGAGEQSAARSDTTGTHGKPHSEPRATTRSAPENRPSSESASAAGSASSSVSGGSTARGSTPSGSDENSSGARLDSQRHGGQSTRHDSSSASTNTSAKTKPEDARTRDR